MIALDARAIASDGEDGDGGSDPLVAFEQPNIVIETVKRAEDGNGLIVRGYESQRRRGPVTLRTNFALASASHTNLLEEHQSDLAINDGAATMDVRPYQIFTLRLIPA